VEGTGLTAESTGERLEPLRTLRFTKECGGRAAGQKGLTIVSTEEDGERLEPLRALRFTKECGGQKGLTTEGTEEHRGKAGITKDTKDTKVHQGRNG
jgi:hypothetical protein